jgi:PAP2 superfamily
MRFHSAEWFVVRIIAALAIVDAALVLFRGVQIDWSGYGAMLSMSVAAIAIGSFYRWRGDERIALAAIATGLFIVFTSLGAAFNYLLLPVSAARIDPFLMQVDSMLGYDWATFATAVATNPLAASSLRFVYLSVLPQMIVVIIALGFAGKGADLHRFLITGVISALITICFWGFFPSSGPSAYSTLGADVAATGNLVVSPLYGAELTRLMAEGATLLSPKDTLGLIAFPSYHTVMALLSVTFLMTFRKVWPLVLAFNVPMAPAILAHGGHHLVDMVAGTLVFVVSLKVTNFVTSRPETGPDMTPAHQN